MVQTEAEALWYLYLTPEQQAAYDDFTAQLKTSNSALVGHDDKFTLLRFLKARQWDTARAYTMYTDMVKWRTEQRVQDLLTNFDYPEHSEVHAVYPHFYHKTDKFGRPLYIELIGRTNPTKLLQLSPLERFMDYHIFCWERLEQQLLPACSESAGKPVVTTCVIVDLSGLSMSSFTLAAQHLLKTVAKVDQDYYPEHLGQMFIINTPLIFKAMWSVVYPLLEERTRKKIMVLGYDYKATLLELIPEENLPTLFGGSSPCLDTRTSFGAWTGEEGECMTPHGPVKATAFVTERPVFAPGVVV